MQRDDPQPADGTAIIALDRWLEPYADALRARYARFCRLRDEIVAQHGSLADFADGHHIFGFNRGRHDGQEGVWYREWAPGAQALSLIGDFNDWQRDATALARDEWGVWSVFLPDRDYGQRFLHHGRIKVHVVGTSGAVDRIPAYVNRAYYEPATQAFTGEYWRPPTPYAWQHETPRLERGLRVYEAHVGMALEEHRIGTYREFAQSILPRIRNAGYNALQLMAVAEHPYYASFGYHVSNFFAPSSRFGTPEELKYLIDEAHRMGLIVLMDLVHSHSVKNIFDGLNGFDGTDHQYFHAPPRGDHPAWDSKVFDYSKREVLRFLLSNCRYWLEEFRFDGFRFDGITSMMYQHHGLGVTFGSYDSYLRDGLDEDAITYLQLANELIHELRPEAITIAEDVSGMVGLARPVAEGGIGFDYRLAMGLPDYWTRTVSKVRDEAWEMGALWGTLTNRRPGEKHIAYVESHDQSLVGDKTIAFWLMDAEMYRHMGKGNANPVIERGCALHKLIRLATFAAGGEGYLNFIGNEFGHPEWVDFPREGNNESFHYARRQWSLVDNPLLRYRDLASFDRAMLALDEQFDLLQTSTMDWIMDDDGRKLLAFRRGDLVLVFNFHPRESYPGLRVGVPDRRDYRIVLNSDDIWFGGHAIVEDGQKYPWQDTPSNPYEQSVQVYLPARSVQVLAPA